MKVVVATLNYAPEPTGIAPYSAGLATGLAARGHEVRVLTSFPHYPQWQHGDDVRWRTTTVEDGVQVTRLRHYVPQEPHGARRVASELSFGARLVAQRMRPDVVIGVSPAMFSTAMLARRTRSLRGGGPALGVVVQDLYGPGLEQIQGQTSRSARLVARLETELLAAADGVSVIHDRFKTVLCDRMGVVADRVVVNRNWTHLGERPVSDRGEDRARRGWADDEVVVLHTGAMGEKQGLDNVVEAARLADAEGVPVRFVLVGDGSQRARLARSATDVKSIEFHDPFATHDFATALASADVLLVNEKPGVVETAVPSKLTSYFSSGRPVLAAADERGTTAFEVAASGAGFRVDPGDPRSLLRAALELGSDHDRATRLGALGPAYSARVLDRDVILDGYESWLHDLCKARDARA